MTKPKLPSGGGSYIRDDKGALKLTAATKPAANPAPKLAKPKASPAADRKEPSE